MNDQESLVVGVPGQPYSRSREVFVGHRHFVCDAGARAPVKIGGLWNRFHTFFDSCEDVVQPRLPLDSIVLPNKMSNADALALAGGGDRAAVWLSEIYDLMQRQPQGPATPEGKLETAFGSTNIFFVPQLVAREGDGFSFVDLDVNQDADDDQETGEAEGKKTFEVKREGQFFQQDGSWYFLRKVVLHWGDGAPPTSKGWILSASAVTAKKSRRGCDAGSRLFFRDWRQLQLSLENAA